jgi:hypothetical protein
VSEEELNRKIPYWLQHPDEAPTCVFKKEIIEEVNECCPGYTGEDCDQGMGFLDLETNLISIYMMHCL